MNLVIIIPAYNEEKMIGKVLDELIINKPKNIKIDIVVVNDGSIDKTQQISKIKGVTVLKHIINRGLGGALGTGLEYARSKNADIVVTMDADGQHSPLDLKRIIKPILNKEADFVIGSRLLGNSKMPVDRKIINYLANFANFLLWGVWVTDTQSGLRGFSKKAIQKINIKMNKMEVSSEFLKEAKKNKLIIQEVPIKAIYTNYSRKKGQSNLNAVNVFAKLILHRFANLK